VTSLRKTLERLKTCQPAPDEIIVHADGADAEILKFLELEYPEVQRLSSPTLQGPGGSRNKLVAAARNELVANFDDDSFPEETDYFARVSESFSLFPEAAILSATNHDDPPFPARFMRIAVASGCGCVFRKSWYQRVGGFVPLPIAYNMEEVDMGLRLHAINGLIVQDAELKVIHDKPHPTEVSASFNAYVLANTFLLPYLRFPIWLWPAGIWKVLHRVSYLLRKGWTAGILEGLRMTPEHLQKHRSWRKAVPASKVASWMLLSRFPAKLNIPKTTETL
jgi:glycosyltransferase involved in cell wall biosynthesis